MPQRIYPTVAETIATQRMLIEEFGGRHGIRDKGLLESAVFRPQSGYYGGIIEEAAALMESLANNRAFIDGRKRVSFVMADAMLRANGYFLDVDAVEAHKVIIKALDEKRFRFPMICEWMRSIVNPA
jgi:death-on-curing protein